MFSFVDRNHPSAPVGTTSADCIHTLASAAECFLESWCDPDLLGAAFCRAAGPGNGKTRLQRISAAAGWPNRPGDLLKELLHRMKSNPGKPLCVGKLVFAPAFLVHLWQVVDPVERLYAIRDVRRLEALTGQTVPSAARADMQKVIDSYPVKLSSHILRQLRFSKAVAAQYLPFTKELANDGPAETWNGQNCDGLIEQMYPNRVILLLSMRCPVYCRFCFRKHKQCRSQPQPTPQQIRAAARQVTADAMIEEVLLTGGDALMHRRNLQAALEELAAAPGIHTLRIGTRTPVYAPFLLTVNDSVRIQRLLHWARRLEEAGKRLEVGIHLIHPDEVSPALLEWILKLTTGGIAVYVQTPLLAGINDGPGALTRLFRLLRGAGAQIHYIFTPCHPIRGNRRYRSTVAAGLAVARELRRELAERALPRISAPTAIGKLDWQLNGWVVAKDRRDPRHLWLQTPFTAAYFRRFAPQSIQRDDIRENADGRLQVRMLADAGDLPIPGPMDAVPKMKTTPPAADGAIPFPQKGLYPGAMLPSLVSVPSTHLSRTHLAVAQIDADAEPPAFEYIRNHAAITDVVVLPGIYNPPSFEKMAKTVQRLAQIAHIRVVRLHWPEFVDHPDAFDSERVGALARLQRPAPIHGMRIELEIYCCHARILNAEHRSAAARLRRKGIFTYADVPLLAGYNTCPQAVVDSANALRAAGIFCNRIWVAGLPLQIAASNDPPVGPGQIVAISAALRQNVSGRGIPHMVAWTPLGEVDIGIGAEPVRIKDRWALRIKACHLDHFRRLDPGFQWPAGIRFDDQGNPLVFWGH